MCYNIKYQIILNRCYFTSVGSSAQPGTEETRPAHVRKENRQKPINSVVTKIPKTENYRPVVKYQGLL